MYTFHRLFVLLLTFYLCLFLIVSFPSVTKAIQDKSLVLYFPFEEGSGNATKDLSGNGNTGTTKNAEWIKDGKKGKAIFFDGKSSYVEVADSKSLDMDEGITIEAWINAESFPGDYPRIVMKGYGTAYELDAKNTSSIDWEANVGAWHECNSGNNTIKLKQWHHIAGTFDGKAMKIFIDGAEKIACAYAGKLGITTDILQIGAYTPKNAVCFNGIIDEVAIYNKALNLSEIQKDMADGVFPLAVNALDKLAVTWGHVKMGY